MDEFPGSGLRFPGMVMVLELDFGFVFGRVVGDVLYHGLGF
jgi:hypothetical protein